MTYLRIPLRALLPLAAVALLAAGCPSVDRATSATDAAPASAPTPQPEAVEAEPEAAEAEAASERPARRLPTMPPDLESGETGTYGGTFSLPEPALSIAEALEQCADTGELCRVQGQISTVCQNRGCWFTIDSDATEYTIRVRMQDYAFFVPKNTGGGEVELEGRLTRRLVPVEEVQHYAEDAARNAGEDATIPEITEPEVTWEFMATVIRITLP